MVFKETKLKDAYIIDLEIKTDERGGFARFFCVNEFKAQGLVPLIAQGNLSFNLRAGTLRGMHYQVAPHCETKYIRCVRGAVFDVIVDLRPDSATYLQHLGVELTADNRRALYIPEMFAHGYQALTDGAEVIYLASEYYAPGAEQGFRFDDPVFRIEWPMPVTVISSKDAEWPAFKFIPKGDL